MVMVTAMTAITGVVVQVMDVAVGMGMAMDIAGMEGVMIVYHLYVSIATT